MNSDIRETEYFREAAGLHYSLRQPGSGQISDAAELTVTPDGTHALFSGTLVDRLEGELTTRICRIDLASGDTSVLTFGPNVDRAPSYAPDGRRAAFLSDGSAAGESQLHLLDPASGVVKPTPRVPGRVEYFHWSADGSRILLGVAGHGADLASERGAVTSKTTSEPRPSWMPWIDVGAASDRRRSVWVYECATDTARQISPSDLNVWEAAWCGERIIAVIASHGHSEGHWFQAALYVVDLRSGQARQLYVPRDRLGWLAGAPAGKHLVVVEAVCSDRSVVAGDLRLIDLVSGSVAAIDTRGVDIACTEWRWDTRLLVAGHRGCETVVGFYDLVSGRFVETWSSAERTTGGRYVQVTGLGDAGDCVLTGEGFTQAPEIATIRGGQYRSIRSFDLGFARHADAIGGIERHTWRAPDGLDIEGWLLLPQATPPHPAVMQIHGGPVWHWRPRWLCRTGVPTLMLLKRGYAVFQPNPRGSSGYGQAFARRVVGDICGADTHDLLAGLDMLARRGIIDPNRLGVTGVSYGASMTSWLVTQDSRFRAAVSVAPATNRVSQRLLSNHPQFVDLFVGDDYRNPIGKYFQRSPVMHAHKVRTPTLNVCGALDRCTPPQEAMQFHSALLENGVESMLVMYPQEGHGIMKFPAVIDYAARVVGWLDGHLAQHAGGKSHG